MNGGLVELSLPVDQLERIVALAGGAPSAVACMEVVPGGVRWAVLADAAFVEVGPPGRTLASVVVSSELVSTVVDHARHLAVTTVRLDTEEPASITVGALTIVLPVPDASDRAVAVARPPVVAERAPARLVVDRDVLLAAIDAATAHPRRSDGTSEVLLTVDPGTGSAAVRRSRPAPTGPVALMDAVADDPLALRLRPPIVRWLLRRLTGTGELRLAVCPAPGAEADDDDAGPGARWLIGTNAEGVRFGLLAADGRAEARRHDLEAAIASLIQMPPEAVAASRDYDGDYPVHFGGRPYYARLGVVAPGDGTWEARVRITTFVAGPAPEVEEAARAEHVGHVVAPDGYLALSIDLPVDPVDGLAERADAAVQTLHLVTAEAD